MKLTQPRSLGVASICPAGASNPVPTKFPRPRSQARIEHDWLSPDIGARKTRSRGIATVRVSLKIARPWSQRRAGQRIPRRDSKAPPGRIGWQDHSDTAPWTGSTDSQSAVPLPVNQARPGQHPETGRLFWHGTADQSRGTLEDSSRAPERLIRLVSLPRQIITTASAPSSPLKAKESRAGPYVLVSGIVGIDPSGCERALGR
jgi:hypothetical protein